MKFKVHWQQKNLSHVLAFHNHVLRNILLFSDDTSASSSKKQMISAYLYAAFAVLKKLLAKLSGHVILMTSRAG